MIILSVCYKHKKGGFNKRLYKLYRAMAERNNTVHYIAIEPFPIKHQNIKQHILWAPFNKTENFLFWIYFIFVAPFYCVWVAKEHKIEKVVVFSTFYAFICGLVVILLRKKMVTFLRIDTVRESSLEKKPWYNLLGYYLFEHIGLRLSCLIVPNSNSLKQAVSSRNKNLTFSVLPNNIEREISLSEKERTAIREQYGLFSDCFVVGTASRLNRVKNIGFLIEAFSKVKNDSTRLVIVGEDLNNTGEGLRLKKLAQKLNIHKQTVFTGWLEQPNRLISAFDLFIFPTLQEGSPNALLEALACNVACLGSRIPEIVEILKEDELLFSISSPEELTQKIRRNISDPSYAKKILEFSIRRKDDYQFNWDSRAVDIILKAGKSDLM